ncbi:hypothetical protein D777_00550 [Marinobacter nitratireducens]|uniref:Outer membrane lipoprotein-sorting protein n=1 Tax=Marinobacter nitratireducens TaxID=1137280 RepID=A0A072N7M8_9GAMM|nr:DUF1329 domain-containing protein [Marinobacter nitratireducens]KEF32988.1 hypothetical protein D777_00550 [Marinobacter nitratireducens]TNE98600.1 MAG: DUF1329 domain-containing protein [Gammaproteobacteria bacterium]
MRNRLVVGFAAVIVGFSGQALSKVTEAEAARLDKDLTPLGAEREGNAAGTIPAWTGGLKTPPANWQEGEVEVNPYPDDQAMFVINAGNLDLYRDKLSDGHVKLLQQYGPDFFMPIYQTRRTAAFPERVYEKSKENALTAELLDNGNGVRNTITTSPFPIPENGLEVIWNHILRYRGEEVSFRSASATPLTDGSYNPVVNEYDYYFAYSKRDAELDDIDNKIFYLKTDTVSPPSIAGTITLVHETLDQIRSPRLAWRYDSGSRRLRRSPNLAYETDLPNSSSLRSVDQKDMYNGAPNQYDWTLKGKREMYVPYNAYKLHDEDVVPDDVIRPRHINQALTRYELHRVWVVEAKVRTGISHIYHRRVFYVDEDSWQILMSEEYDDNGNLWRVSEAHNISYYSQPVFWTTMEMTYDLKAQRYYIDGLSDGFPAYDFNPGFRSKEFSASAARRAARR